MDELIDIVDFEGKPTGETSLKSVAHKKGLWHSCIHVWMMDMNDQILIQKRGANVTISPNKWDVSVAGHISAGELPIDAAVREVSEEIGLKISKKELNFRIMQKGEVIHSNGLIDNGFYHLYLCKTDFELQDLKPQKEEVAELKLMSLSDFETEVQKENSYFVDREAIYYQLVLVEIRKFLLFFK